MKNAHSNKHQSRVWAWMKTVSQGEYYAPLTQRTTTKYQKEIINVL
ncbi:hypothetical protein YPPY66_0080 [Yersinia pestis PY-66]|nr:hypothetical protein YpUG050454_3288 [Yersinia pestis biovar Antiqua str. UG05-0454]EIQ88856.1 hypothetical protein YPPY01_2238 [Yersinia pestis PY-01]EIR34480.1 hypothetical protein YPPY12_2454 [Yersinia pestis PY-12]EIR49639.1 hypothetical protein YPPY14_2264 [Yersinia pestis PY-14]EIS18551.1 hypothetical protein YPPY52_2346 [Yersinia pestis PY-52]EIS32438.1 hypothetical protein YPPY56_2353 [Yersinia pestis PY-56]EIS75991.1 hypothetical protein YPPY66_2515 [Yersinia pestis PY-66]EIT4066